jgi:uncharacterized LabA/DUF88 family protein
MFVDRSAIFIDGAYFDKLLEQEFDRARVDFSLLPAVLAQGDKVLRTYYYHCPPYMSQPPTEDELRRFDAKDRFFQALNSLSRFQVRLGRLLYRGTDGQGRPIFIQKLVDIMLGVDLVRMAATRQITKAVLVAGDSDFVPAVDEAKRLGVLVSLWHGPVLGSVHGSSVHRELWNACDERSEITKALIESVQRQYSNGAG